VGIGDDAAVLDQEGADYLLATVDMLMEDVHFTGEAVAWFDLGRRAMAVNISDIAAMGGTPTAALTSLAARPDTPLQEIEDIYRGIRQEAEQFGASVVGGNITRTSGPMALDVALLGRVPKSEMILRSGAHVGDVLAVTGSLGDAAAARLGFQASSLQDDEAFHTFRLRHAVPQPRVEAGRLLASSRLVHAMLDVSDGLGGDVQHLARASGVGAVIYSDRLPVSTTAQRVANSLEMDATSLALGGGEDYELLIALPEADVKQAQVQLGQIPLTVVGRVVPASSGCTLETDSGREPLPVSGWRHF